MKKLIGLFFINIIFLTSVFSQVINDSQVIDGKHWIYKAMNTLALESKKGIFTANTPVTAGELKIHFREFDREMLSDSGKKLYDKAEEYLFSEENLFPVEMFKAGLGIKLAPELCYKSNEQIDWTYNYYYKDNPISAQLDLGISQYFCMGGNYFIGKNWKYSHKSDNFTNLPLDFNQYEFEYPRFAYGSIGYFGENWGINAHLGKEGLTIGNTATGSIIYNNTFETAGYFQLTAFCNDVKYTMNVAEIQPEKFLYWHQIDVRLFDKLKLGAMEGALINRSFEIRFLNPMMVYHSFAFWKNYTSEEEDHYYNEGYCCSYLGLTFEYNPVRYLRLYGLYAMNEMQLPNELVGRYRAYPDSFGGQLGAELTVPSAAGGYWHTALEGVYCSPYLYIKQAPGWSLYKERADNNDIGGETINSWIGTPFGPDTLAVDLQFGYEQPDKWDAGFEYLLSFKGEKDFGLFDKVNFNEHEYKDKKLYVWDYYPYTKYVIADDDNDEAACDAAVEDGRRKWMSGCCQTKHQIGLEGGYSFTENIRLQGQVIYSFVINAQHIPGNFQHGVQCALSAEFKLF